MANPWIDEPIIDAVITASDELFPWYTKDDIAWQKCWCSQQYNQSKNENSCCGWSCGCHQGSASERKHPLEWVEPIPIGKTRLDVPLTDEQIKKISEITARDLESDDDNPSDEEIALLQQMFGVK